jgi:hypothetical protein
VLISVNPTQRTVKATLRHAENARFLERFRYVIVTSQLLNAQMNLSHFGPGVVSVEVPTLSMPARPAISVIGVLATGIAAYLLVWIVYWARGGSQQRLRIGRALAALVVTLALAVIIYAYVRRRRIENLRGRAFASAARFVSQSQAFDVAAVGALAAIQDVELVARGFRL